MNQWHQGRPGGHPEHHGHGGSDDFAGMEALLAGVMGQDGAGMLRGIVQGQDRQFWMGALIGAGAVLLATSPAVREALGDLFGDKRPPAPETAPASPPEPAPAPAKPKHKRVPKTKS